MTDDQFNVLLGKAIHLWQEDDAAPDAERLGAALERFWPHASFELHNKKYARDDGDATWHLYDVFYGYYIIVCASYRSNNDIYVVNKESKKNQTTCDDVAFAIGVKDDKGGIGMCHGPFPTLQQALDIYPGERNVIVRFEKDQDGDMAEQIIFKVKNGKWFDKRHHKRET